MLSQHGSFFYNIIAIALHLQHAAQHHIVFTSACVLVGGGVSQSQ